MKVDMSALLTRRCWSGLVCAEFTMEFFVPGEAKPKARPRFAKATGHAYTPKRTQDEEAVIRATAMRWMQRNGMSQPWDGPLTAEVTALIDKPKDWWEGKEPGRGDVDNYAKLVTDALNKVVFKDDRQIVELVARKGYSDTPGIRVRLDLYPGCEKPRKRARAKKVV